MVDPRDSPNSLTQRQAEVLDIFGKNSKISKRALAKSLGINVSAAQEHIDQLKEKGFLSRIGGTRGHWEVNELK